MIPKNRVTVSLTPELRLKQALKDAGVKKPASVRKLTISGMLALEDFHYVQTRMRRTLQALSMGSASIEENKIPDWAFNHCIGLTSVSLPNSVEKIGNCAFWECNNLTSITIPDSLKEVGADAFFNCPGITSTAILPESYEYKDNDDKVPTILCDKFYELRTWLAEYIPEHALDEVMYMLQKYSIHLKTTKSRRSLWGTYIPPWKRNYHVITINDDLNKYEFLEVFLHEYAHLLVQVNYGCARTHGIEWKNCFRGVLHHFIRKNIFPNDIRLAIQDYMVKTYAKSTLQLCSILAKYGTRKNHCYPFDLCCCCNCQTVNE